MKQKRGEINLPLIILTFFGIITLTLVASFIYLSINGEDYSDRYSKTLNPLTKFALEGEEKTSESDLIIQIDTDAGERKIIIKNKEDINLTEKELEEELIRYTVTILKLYNLHQIPFTSITPKIQIYLEKKAYFLEVDKGDILFKEGETQTPDIILRTTYEEIFKSLEDKEYIKESIQENKTKIEIIANKFVLFAKGYFILYKEFEGYF